MYCVVSFKAVVSIGVRGPCIGDCVRVALVV